MGIFSFVSSIFKPAADLIDNLHTSEEEKLELKKQISQVENEFQSKVLDYETKLMEAQSSVIRAETTSQSWITRNWRPITMLTFLVLVVCDSFGILANDLAPEAWTLLQIGLGGYVVGRSAEKIVPAFTKKRSGTEAKG
jgi:hypothetical protein